MRIAVNARFLALNELEGYGYFTKEVFIRMAEKHPEHRFIFLFDRPFDGSADLPVNAEAVVVTPKARHFMSFKWWFDVKIPMALKRYKADVFISPDGFCSLTTSLPQVLVVHDLAFRHFPAFIPKHHLAFYKLFTGSFLKKAKAVATVSTLSKKDIMEKYGIMENKITVVGSAAKPVFKPMFWPETEEVKEQYAEGYDYFLFVGGIHPRKNLLNLLKAFSLFKVRQRSSIKLLVAGRLAWDNGKVIDKLKSYKFRNDVKLLGYLPESELARVVASAYALVYPSYFEGFGVPVLEAMQSGVPVITSSGTSMEEIAGDAALYANPAEAATIADQMKLIYKDEQLRTRLSQQGLQRAQQFNWNDTTEKMWQVVQGAVSP